MDFKKILEKIKPKEEEGFIEVDESLLEEKGEVNVKIENLSSFNDVERIQESLREGNVVFVKIKEMRERNLEELKKCVDRLKKTCMAMNGDMAIAHDDFLVLTPEFAKIYRGKAA
ncbi:MAG: cell division protein SepF [Candidatus Aenigmatarchaeota archaeon]